MVWTEEKEKDGGMVGLRVERERERERERACWFCMADPFIEAN
jgi:hypothetical protein